MLNRLLGKLNRDEDVDFKDLSPEEQAEIRAEEKKARIKYHRDHVANGPANFRWITTGQQRRAAERTQKSLQRKANRRHRRQFLEKQWHLAILRGQLQIIGALPGWDGAPVQATTKQRIEAGQWLVRAFGERDDEGQVVFDDDLLTNAVARAVDTYNAAQRGAA